LAFVVNIATNEIQWAKVHAKRRINPRRSIETPETPEEYISLLQRYIRVAPALASPPSRMSLWHPDLHLDNIFVDQGTKEISYIIDWQSAAVSEPFFQNKMPRMLVPVSSRNSAEKSDAEDEKAN
jgi:Ser/Thr protein kinase RdoA (MazF antagonist)